MDTRGCGTLLLWATLSATVLCLGCRRNGDEANRPGGPTGPQPADANAARSPDGIVDVVGMVDVVGVVDVVASSQPTTAPTTQPATTTQAVTRPASRPVTMPATKPTTKPINSHPATVPATRPAASRPTTQPTTVAATRPARNLPSVRAARKVLADALFDRSAWDKIRKGLKKAVGEALNEADADPATHLAAGDRALARGDHETAVECMYRAVDRDPTKIDSLRGLAVALVAAKRYRKAVPIYEAILGSAPTDEAARFNLALACSRVRDYPRAEKEYRRLVTDQEEHVRGWYNLATLYQLQGKLHDAKECWDKVVRLAPQLPSAHACRGEVLLDLRRPAEAMAAYAETAKLRPMEVGAWLNVSEAARQAGSLGRAATALRKATKLAPLDADVWLRLGDVLMAMHRATDKRSLLTDAVTAWRQSLELDSSQRELREKLEAYESIVTTAPANLPVRPMLD